MSLQKEKIIASAIRMFADKGYSSTSIQDIANDCGIAKGSLYKFFSSKEELLIEVYRNRLHAMFEQVERIKSDAELSPKERFIQETHNQFAFFTEFFSNIQEFYELSMNEEGGFSKFLQHMRAYMLSYYGDCLERAYGQDVERNKWDLVTLYVGIMKGYMSIMTVVGRTADNGTIAAFIVDRMDDMAAGILRSKPEPIFGPAIMDKFVSCGMEGASIPAHEILEEVVSRLLASIHELHVPTARKTELTEAAILIQKEVGEDQPRGVLIRALIGLLQTQHELSGIAGYLEKTIESQRGKCKT
ncbi:TetR/AcrR family transcriptional regulator [Cohnella yongneupensis]|uniref:TetR/AcrR family transcriptional regulator n=1 Tax=Cohnella yongneupensis TaxID=425006 RepID=A0ABW0QT52_9BACL